MNAAAYVASEHATAGRIVSGAARTNWSRGSHRKPVASTRCAFGIARHAAAIPTTVDATRKSRKYLIPYDALPRGHASSRPYRKCNLWSQRSRRSESDSNTSDRCRSALVRTVAHLGASGAKSKHLVAVAASKESALNLLPRPARPTASRLPNRRKRKTQILGAEVVSNRKGFSSAHGRPHRGGTPRNPSDNTMAERSIQSNSLVQCRVERYSAEAAADWPDQRLPHGRCPLRACLPP